MILMNLPNRTRLIDIENKLMVTNGKMEGSGKFVITRYTTIYKKKKQQNPNL